VRRTASVSIRLILFRFRDAAERHEKFAAGFERQLDKSTARNQFCEFTRSHNARVVNFFQRQHIGVACDRMGTIAIKRGGQNPVVIRVAAGVDDGHGLDRVSLSFDKQRQQTRVPEKDYSFRSKSK
jgi:hypothetical protein